MCGICGIVGNGDPDVLDRMRRKLRHRGPDEHGHHLEPGVLLAMQRLSVIDPAGGHQPIANEAGTVWVVMNGEIYNFRELREELLAKGHRFTTNCDTEVVVHLYEEEGEAGVRRLRGMFAYALWDRERRRCLLVRDRLGIKPLYYATSRPAASEQIAVAFASELPSLLEAMPGASVRPGAVAQYLNWLYVPGPETLYAGIRHVRPGEYLRIEGGQCEAVSYYRPPEAPGLRQPVGVGEAAEEFLAVLKDTVRSHLVSDVPLGLFLSGGLDSGSILAMMRAVTDGPIKTFSIGYRAAADHSYNEVSGAKALADRFGAAHTEALLDPDAVTLLPKIVAAMGEPFADSSSIPTYLVSEVARRSVTVALCGIGGDELFGGYPRHLGVRTAARYAALPRGLRAWVGRRLATRLPERDDSRDQVGRLKRFLRDGAEDVPVQYGRWTTFLPAEWGVRALTERGEGAAAIDAASAAVQACYRSWPGRDPADKAMGVDLQTYLPDDLLRMGDRLSMAHSLELRVPYCDHLLLDFALRVPATLRFEGWALKGFMRRALRSVLPPAVTEGPKLGFRVPLARWLREDLREMVGDLLSEETVRRRGYVRPDYVQWVLGEHDAGRRNFADQIYALLVLELWHRTVAGS